MMRYLADLAKRHDAHTFRRFPPEKRYALTACFLVEIQKTILDHIMALHDQLLSKKIREATNAFETRYRQVRRQSKRGLATLIQTGKTLLDPDRPAATTLATLLQDIDAAVLREAVAICDERQRLEDRGEIDALRARYSGLRRYLPAFFALPFRGEPGSEAVLTGLDVVRQLDAGTRTTVPVQAPTVFVPSKFRAALHQPDGTVDRRTWELGLAVAVRDGLRSGDVFLPASRRHVSFANLIYDPTRWTHEREVAYTDLQLPPAPEDFVARLQQAFNEVAHRAASGLAHNPFATIRKGRLHLKRRDALELTPQLQQLWKRQLNRGEGRHQLARRLFFANQGAFQTGDYEEIMNKATCLSLLSNAVVVWNTRQMARIIAQLRASGATITDEDLARVSPLACSHVIPNGTYFSPPTALERDPSHNGHAGGVGIKRSDNM